MRRIAALLLVFASTAFAQEHGDEDPRYRTFSYQDRLTYPLPTSPDTNQIVLFSAGERIMSVRLSDPAAYYLTVSGSGDSIALKAVSRSSLAIMSVETDRRQYELELNSGASEAPPQVVRFVDGRPAPQQASEPPTSGSVNYRLSGNKIVQPASIRDDGVKTYIAWRDSQAIPAVFAIGPTGDEQMVDGYMRAGLFTIDRVYQTLVFKIDKRSATARREQAMERN